MSNTYDTQRFDLYEDGVLILTWRCTVASDWTPRSEPRRQIPVVSVEDGVGGIHAQRVHDADRIIWRFDPWTLPQGGISGSDPDDPLVCWDFQGLVEFFRATRGPMSAFTFTDIEGDEYTVRFFPEGQEDAREIQFDVLSPGCAYQARFSIASVV